ncbi:MAG: hypothetical protein ACLF0P_04135 [Thermoanaerobaculia bacterium]
MRNSPVFSRQPLDPLDGARRPVLVYLAAGLLAVLLGGCASGTRRQVEHHDSHPLGTVSFPVSCSEQARVEFNRAVALLHHMTYPQAGEAFRQVAATDPRCAMAHWGFAMTLFQPLWPTRPGPEELQQGWDAVQEAEALQPPALEHPAGDHGQAAERALDALRGAYMGAVNRRDLEALLELHTEESVSLPAGVPAVEGRDGRWRIAWIITNSDAPPPPR